MQITTVGLDLAKRVFQVHGVDAGGRVVMRRRLQRGEVAAFFADLPSCLVGIEACATAHHWARLIGASGHEVRLIPPSYVKPYVRRSKTDAADAQAICEAVGRPSMRFVPVKSAAQQAALLRPSRGVRHHRTGGTAPLMGTRSADRIRCVVLVPWRGWGPVVADKEGWPAARFLAALAELEIAERGRRRTERNLAEARLLPGKTLDNFDFSVVPMLSKARVMALAAGDTWLDKATNLLRFGPPGTGKSQLRIGDRSCAHRERLPRAVRPHHPHRTEVAGGSPSVATRSRHRQARQISAADPR